MSRRTHSFLALVLVVVALAAAACSNATAPQESQQCADQMRCDWNSNGT